MNQTQRANKVSEINMRNDLLKKGVTKETVDLVIAGYRKATEESAVIRANNRNEFRNTFPEREKRLMDIPNYASYTLKDKTGRDYDLPDYIGGLYKAKKIFCIRDLPVKSVKGNEIILNEYRFDIDKHYEAKEKRRKLRRDVKKAKAYLASPFAKGWLRKMQFTVREDEYGHKFIFLAILAGHNKISVESFRKLYASLSLIYFEHYPSVHLYIGGKVNWTMLYERPDHVNGQETYFSGVVAEDNFSPEDFDRNHSKYSFANAKSYL